MRESPDKPPPDTRASQSSDDFLSGTSGQVTGIRASAAAIAADALLDAAAIVRLERWLLWRAAAAAPRRRVLALGIERTDAPNLLGAAKGELLRSRHEVKFVSIGAGQQGKFENLNALLAEHPPADRDWLLVVDDDVVLPAGFVDAFIFLAERFDFALAQPAHRRRSHAAWNVTRRRIASVARETAFVEIGPVLALHSRSFETLLPFAPLRFGWGLDAHWSALARERNWHIGVIDATPILHSLRPIAASYDRTAAIDEARGFLAGKSYTCAAQANRTLVSYRSWRP